MPCGHADNISSLAQMLLVDKLHFRLLGRWIRWNIRKQTPLQRHVSDCVLPYYFIETVASNLSRPIAVHYVSFRVLYSNYNYDPICEQIEDRLCRNIWLFFAQKCSKFSLFCWLSNVVYHMICLSPPAVVFPVLH